MSKALRKNLLARSVLLLMVFACLKSEASNGLLVSTCTMDGDQAAGEIFFHRVADLSGESHGFLSFAFHLPGKPNGVLLEFVSEVSGPGVRNEFDLLPWHEGSRSRFSSLSAKLNGLVVPVPNQIELEFKVSGLMKGVLNNDLHMVCVLLDSGNG